MKSIDEIEDAIEQLPAKQVAELARWLDKFQSRRVAPPQVKSWLQRARGVTAPGVNTKNILAITRGEE